MLCNNASHMEKNMINRRNLNRKPLANKSQLRTQWFFLQNKGTKPAETTTPKQQKLEPQL